MERISSRDNDKIKQLIRLQNSRKARQDAAAFVAEGVRLAKEALRCNLVVRQAFATEDGAARYADIWDALCQTSSSAYLISDKLETKISEVQSPQGIYCVCDMPDPDGCFLAAGKKILALDQLQDPGNLGTIIRTADAFGADGLILGEGCADRYSPKVLRSAMGSVFRLPAWTVPDLAAALEKMKRAGFACFGAALDGTALRLGEVSFPERAVTVIGNEGNGISQAVLATCGRTLYIPMRGEAESLNAGVAASLILWEMCR
ncbi:MAG: RNA methyltransferase [Oscillospiraceae bacterium]|nr:RNA methyltransferase [Oscillospiraceae bacterium]